MSIMKNMHIVDLRTITSVEAAHAIEEMKNIALLILPEESDPEVLSAIHAIPKTNVATTLTLPKDTKINQLIGQVELTPAILAQDSILVISGQSMVTEPCEECNAPLIVCGQLIYPKSCPVKILSVSGQSKSYDYEHYVSVDDDFELDADTLDLMEYKTLLDIDGDLRVAKDVTIDMLKEKMPYFLVDGDVRCQKNVAAFMKLRAEIDGSLRVKGAAYEEDDDE